MKIRTKLLVSHGLVAVVVTALCVVILIGLNLSDRARRVLEDSYEHLRMINVLNSDANRFSEQIAELFSVGLSGRDELVEAKAMMLGNLQAVEAQARLDADKGRESSRGTQLQAKLDWAQHMRERTEELGRVGDTIVMQLSAGNLREAQRIYATAIENRLDAEIADLIADATEVDAARVQQALQTSDELTEQARLLAISIVVIGAVLAIGNALVIDRQVSRPITGLAVLADDLADRHSESAYEGYSAKAGWVVASGMFPLAAGGLTAGRRDEIGHLFERFHDMASRIYEQQAKLRSARDSLAAEVATQTASLHQRSVELEQANTRLTALDASRAKFFADISHELRTPLTVLRGQAEVSLRNPATTLPDMRKVMTHIVRKSAQLGRMVDDLLFLARSDSGAIEVVLQKTMMQDVTAEALHDSALLKDGKEVTIALRQPEAPLWVMADAERLRQAVIILLDNAIRHSPQAGTVTLELKRDGAEATLLVSDQGHGFTEAERDRAFDRFFRGKASSRQRGAGLGLPIARWIVMRHDGSIGILSNDRPSDTTGADIEIRLPLVQATTAADTGTQEDEERAGTSSREGGKPWTS